MQASVWRASAAFIDSFHSSFVVKRMISSFHDSIGKSYVWLDLLSLWTLKLLKVVVPQILRTTCCVLLPGRVMLKRVIMTHLWVKGLVVSLGTHWCIEVNSIHDSLVDAHVSNPAMATHIVDPPPSTVGREVLWSIKSRHLSLSAFLNSNSLFKLFRADY